jgi:4-amino-4-deoxy-L-arabinose transferase-like glycosyltransferase
MSQFASRHWPVAILLIGYAWVCSTLIPVSVDDIRMADVFSVDESGAAAELRYFFTTGRLERASFKYGSLFYYVPLVFLHIFGLFADVTDRVILIVLRSFGAVSGAGCLVVVYLLGRRLCGQASGFIACLMLATSSVFLRWSVEAHPDLPQLFLVCGFFWYLIRFCEEGKASHAYAATGLAALAFNIKYVGVFLMPTLWVSLLLFGNLEKKTLLDRVRLQLPKAAVTLLIFVAVAAATNPYALIKFGAFTDSLQAEREIMSFGHTFRKDRNYLLWVRQSIDVIGWVHIAVLLVYAVYKGWKGERPRPTMQSLFIFVGSYLLYLTLFSSLVRGRHILPLFPVLAVASGGAYVGIWALLGQSARRVLFRGVWVGVGVLGFLPAITASNETISSRSADRENRVEILAGRWIADHYDPAKSILYDSYAYVPVTFADVARTFGMTYLAIEHFRPDILVVRDAIVSDYADPGRGADSRVGEIAYLDSHYFYKYLLDEKLPSFRLAKNFGTVRVYESSGFEKRDILWSRLMAMFGSGKALGVARARQVMASVHLSAGNQVEADRQRVLSERTRNHAHGRYTKATGLLRDGQLDEATVLFDEVLEMIAARPDSYRAAIQQHVARSYFESSYFAEAAVSAQKAVEMFDGLSEAHFELGVFLLATGDLSSSDRVLQNAVKRFGGGGHAKSLLSQLAGHGIQPEAAKRAIELYFGERE